MSKDNRTCDCLREHYSQCDTLDDQPEYEADPDCLKCGGTGIPGRAQARPRHTVAYLPDHCEITTPMTHEDTQECGLEGLKAAKREREGGTMKKCAGCGKPIDDSEYLCLQCHDKLDERQDIDETDEQFILDMMKDEGGDE